MVTNKSMKNYLPELFRKVKKEEVELVRKKVMPPKMNLHTVQEGESLSAIAEKHYGKSGKEYYEWIYKHNRMKIGPDMNELAAGIEIMIPKLSIALGGDFEPKVPEGYLAVHEVKAGETLSDLAQKYYGHATPDYFKLIYEVNKEEIGDNMNVVRAGIDLLIPELKAEPEAKAETDEKKSSGSSSRMAS